MVNFGNAELNYNLEIIDKLRQLDVRSELYPDAVKLKKQMSYADLKKIPYIIIAGEDEIKNNSLIIKIMATGEQKKINMNEIDSFVNEVIKKIIIKYISRIKSGGKRTMIYDISSQKLTIEKIGEILKKDIKLTLSKESVDLIRSSRSYLDQKLETQFYPLYMVLLPDLVHFIIKQ